jgi:hypothetical protein
MLLVLSVFTNLVCGRISTFPNFAAFYQAIDFGFHGNSSPYIKVPFIGHDNSVKELAYFENRFGFVSLLPSSRLILNFLPHICDLVFNFGVCRLCERNKHFISV